MIRLVVSCGGESQFQTSPNHSSPGGIPAKEDSCPKIEISLKLVSYYALQ